MESNFRSSFRRVTFGKLSELWILTITANAAEWRFGKRMGRITKLAVEVWSWLSDRQSNRIRF